MYALSHPACIEEALVKNHRQFMRKGRGLRSNSGLLGNGVFISEGEFYRQQRRLMQPAFHRSRIETYAKVMVAYTERALRDWIPGKPRDIYQDMIRLTMAIVAKTLFDMDVTTREAVPVSAALAATMEHFRAKSTFTFLLPPWIPTPANLRHRKAVAELDRIVFDIVDRRRRNSGEHDDLLNSLLQARYDDGTRMNDRQLRDEVVNLFLAGHETTAIILAWAVVCLNRNLYAQECLIKELQRELRGRAPIYADLPRLRYTESVVLETMRLYPPVWLITREAIEDCEVGGIEIRRGSSILMSQWVVHRDGRFFDNPEVFNPDRWMGNPGRDLPTGAYFPFSLAARACIGKAFGMAEAILLIATIFQKYHLELVADHPIEVWPSLTLRPLHGIMAIPRPR